MKKKLSWVAVLAVITAFIGAVAGVATFLKNKSKKLKDELDFDDTDYFDDEFDDLDDDFDDDVLEGQSDDEVSDEIADDIASEGDTEE